jgi:hypothetical protein
MKPITHPLKGTPGNTIFYGDNLPILREHIPDESVDLVYLDSPFTFSIADLLAGKSIEMPPAHGTFKKAERIKKSEGQQGKLGL